LPGGKLRGDNYFVRNPKRLDRKPTSFSVNIRTGVWKDFIPGGDSGSDIPSLLAWLFDISYREAAENLATVLGLSVEVGR
jgi:putative DNA primase/helicase